MLTVVDVLSLSPARPSSALTVVDVLSLSPAVCFDAWFFAAAQMSMRSSLFLTTSENGTLKEQRMPCSCADCAAQHRLKNYGAVDFVQWTASDSTGRYCAAI